MPKICFYFQVHQPYRMRHYHLFDIGKRTSYFDDKVNRDICRKVASKCYLPANAMLLDLLKKHPEFKISYSISGVALEQFAEYCPEVITSFQTLVATGQVEILSETYYHSLAAVQNKEEFKEQILLHQKLVKKLFKVKPTVFRNTELIYSDDVAKVVEEMGFDGMITEGADHILGGKSPNFVYQSANSKPIKLLLKNYKLSDDIAFRFSERAWADWPLTTDKFARWVHSLDGSTETVNLFMDYETIGEHQWEETGIFDFFRSLPEAVLKHPQFSFATPSEVLAEFPVRDTIHVPHPISWADSERDLSAWLGNPMQDATIAWLYSLEKAVKRSHKPKLLEDWRKLQTSDHFYYMCTKFWSDGDVHKYFSVYDAPHESYVIMNNVLTDLETKLMRYVPA